MLIIITLSLNVNHPCCLNADLINNLECTSDIVRIFVAHHHHIITLSLNINHPGCLNTNLIDNPECTYVCRAN